MIANTFWAASAAAQSASRNDVFGRYQQAIWQERDGLPQNTVLAIATTRDGYLWMGTYGGGVSRLSGGRFTQYSVQEGCRATSSGPCSKTRRGLSGSAPMAAA
jgi:ligand-binding sensor domain-containing protein